MNVDPPGPSESDKNLLGQARDAANGATSGPRGQTTETLTDSPARLPKRIGQFRIRQVIASGAWSLVGGINVRGFIAHARGQAILDARAAAFRLSLRHAHLIKRDAAINQKPPRDVNRPNMDGRKRQPAASSPPCSALRTPKQSDRKRRPRRLLLCSSAP